MPRTAAQPTFDQLHNLIERAERKGGLTAAEGERLRAGLRGSTSTPGDSREPLEVADLRRRNLNLTASVSYWKRKASGAGTTTPAPAPAIETPAPTPAPAPAPAPVADTPAPTDDAAALRRVTALAQRWLHIPAKRQAATSVLAAITNKDDDA
jgi:hypothetical protein